jgi:hypothetical protein
VVGPRELHEEVDNELVREDFSFHSYSSSKDEAQFTWGQNNKIKALVWFWIIDET